MPLESSGGELQVCFRSHPDRRSEQGVMNYQSPKSLNQDNLETILGLPLGVPRQKAIRMWPPWSGAEDTIWGKVVAPRVLAVVSQVSPKLPMACPSTKGAPKCELTNLLVGLMQVRVSE
jgi:hypothetical protein